MDSKIWKVKCIPGLERQLVDQLLRKAFDYINNGKPFMILSVFNCDKSSGYVYIEAYNMSHVKSFVHGIKGITQQNYKGNSRNTEMKNNIEMVPYREMP